MIKTSGFAVVAAAVVALGGCASVRQVQSDVSSYSQWPSARPAAAATYAFERLPSQQSRPERQQALEDAARPAIEAAGFRPAASPGSADVNVQVTANVTQTVYPEPFGWYGGLGFGHGRGRHAFASGFGMNYYGSLRYEREVALLIRDRSNGAALYETRARSEGLSSAIDEYLPAMFVAALKDFPSAAVNPRRIVVDLPVVR